MIERLVHNFERVFTNVRTVKHPQEKWPEGRVYIDLEMNDMFMAYWAGYSLGRHSAPEEGGE